MYGIELGIERRAKMLQLCFLMSFASQIGNDAILEGCCSLSCSCAGHNLETEIWLKCGEVQEIQQLGGILTEFTNCDRYLSTVFCFGTNLSKKLKTCAKSLDFSSPLPPPNFSPSNFPCFDFRHPKTASQAGQSFDSTSFSPSPSATDEGAKTRAENFGRLLD